jgi:hypothetical protein
VWLVYPALGMNATHSSRKQGINMTGAKALSPSCPAPGPWA